MQREAHTSVARERFTRVERVFAQLRALQNTHAPRQRQHNCAIVYDLPPNLEPRACLDSRAFGGKRGTVFVRSLRGSRVDSVAPRRVGGQHIAAFGPCAITFSAKYPPAQEQTSGDMFMCFAPPRPDNYRLEPPIHLRFLISRITW